MYMECHTTRRCKKTLRTFNFVFVCVCVCTLLVQSLLTLNLRKQQSHSQLLVRQI